jgi:WD40 repeat protein
MKNIPLTVKELINYYYEKIYIKTLNYNNCICSGLFATDGQIIVSYSDDGTMKLWDVCADTNIGAKYIKTIIGHTTPIKYVTFSPDGQIIASCSYDTIKLWTRNCDLIRTMISQYPNAEFSDIRFSPDGQTITTNCGGITNLWTINGEFIALIEYHISDICSVESSHGKRIILTRWKETNFKTWNISRFLNDEDCISVFGGHTDWISRAEFSPDGQMIVSCSLDKTIKLWDVCADTIIGAKCIKTLFEHTDSVHSVKFSPDGQMIVSCSHNTVKLWSCDGELIKTIVACSEPYYIPTEFSSDGKMIIIHLRGNIAKILYV